MEQLSVALNGISSLADRLRFEADRWPPPSSDDFDARRLPLTAVQTAETAVRLAGRLLQHLEKLGRREALCEAAGAVLGMAARLLWTAKRHGFTTTGATADLAYVQASCHVLATAAKVASLVAQQSALQNSGPVSGAALVLFEVLNSRTRNALEAIGCHLHGEMAR